jgi:AbrB family looped-hinge helix DNA binding protein
MVKSMVSETYHGEGKVNSKGAIVIPASLRKYKNIKEGDHLAFVELVNGDIVIKRPKRNFFNL